MNTEKPEVLKSPWRIRLGFVFFIIGIAWPVLIPIFSLLNVSASLIAVFSGVMLIAAEVIMLIGAAIAGKEGFALIKSRALSLLKSIRPPQVVSATQYRIGLVMFSVPLIFGWAAPYLGHHLPGFETADWIYAVSFDVIFLISLFLLGGGFWDKLAALFLHKAEVVFPPKTVAQSSVST